MECAQCGTTIISVNSLSNHLSIIFSVCIQCLINNNFMQHQCRFKTKLYGLQLFVAAYQCLYVAQEHYNQSSVFLFVFLFPPQVVNVFGHLPVSSDEEGAGIKEAYIALPLQGSNLLTD